MTREKHDNAQCEITAVVQQRNEVPDKSGIGHVITVER